MSYLEELLPEFRKGAKIRQVDWNDSEYIQFNGRYIHNQDGDEVLSCDLDFQDIIEQNWEFYSEPETNWSYVLENKCLCWFYDDDTMKQGTMKNLFVDGNGDVRFIDENDNEWLNCRPVRRDEVAFYEDRKDE